MARSKVVGSRLLECFQAYITIQMPKMMDMGATGLDTCHAGFPRFVLVLSLLSVLSFVQLHAESSTFFNFRVRSEQRVCL